jgi:hypothetical protein
VRVFSLLSDLVTLVNPTKTTLAIFFKETKSYGGIGATSDVIVEGSLCSEEG